jgi:predicted HD superfamily hydrolase involved in NAD metabolism
MSLANKRPILYPDTMPADLLWLLDGMTLTGILREDVPTFLKHYGYEETAEHCRCVAEEARRVAIHFGEDPDPAEMAGWLHDCSAIFPAHERIKVARSLNVPVLPEEEKLPMIVHQKLSRVLASQLFHIEDRGVLSAVECHTTLKSNASRLDKVVFVADKIAWDQAGTPPYLDRLMAAFQRSLDHAALAYLSYLWDKRYSLTVLHPWAYEAYVQLALALDRSLI